MRYKTKRGNFIEAIQYTEESKLIDLIKFLDTNTVIKIFKGKTNLIISYNESKNILSIDIGYYIVKYEWGEFTQFPHWVFKEHFLPMVEHPVPDSEDRMSD